MLRQASHPRTDWRRRQSDTGDLDDAAASREGRWDLSDIHLYRAGNQTWGGTGIVRLLPRLHEQFVLKLPCLTGCCRTRRPSRFSSLILKYIRSKGPSGRHPILTFRDVLKLHSRYVLQTCSPTLCGLCHEAPIPLVNPRAACQLSSHIDNSWSATYTHR